MRYPGKKIVCRATIIQTYTASDVRSHLFAFIDRIADEHEPICVMGENNQIVMISAEDYKSIQETLYLMSIPGMQESIEAGRKTKIEDCSTELP